MSATSTSVLPQAPQTPGLSEGQRLANVFFSPSKTFVDLRRSARWWVPFLVICAFSYALSFTVDKKVGFETVSENQIKMSPKASAQMDQLPADQRARRMDLTVKITKGISYAFPVLLLIIDLIVAAVLMATFNFGLGTEITFGQSLAVVFYSGLVGCIKVLLAIIMLFSGSNTDAFNFSNPVGTNPAFYMSITDTARWLYSMASWFDVFTLWTFALIGIGFAVVGRKKISSGIGVMAGWFIVMVLVSSGWAALFS